MKLLPFLCLLALSACSEAPSSNPKGAIEFEGTSYFHRWTGGNQNEFTPDGQEDLDKWTDMVTVIYYPKVKDGEALAQLANVILDTYKENQATVVKTGSIPRTEENPAEHLIIVVFNQPDFMEAAFCRVLIRDNEALSVVYSHRFYGKDIEEEMRAWGKANGPAAEEAIMNLKPIPHADEIPKE